MDDIHVSIPYFAGRPLQHMVLQLPELESYDTALVRFIINGGEKMPVLLIQRILHAFPKA